MAYFFKARRSLFLRLEGEFDPKKLEKLVLTRLETGSMAKIHRLCLDLKGSARARKIRARSTSTPNYVGAGKSYNAFRLPWLR